MSKKVIDIQERIPTLREKRKRRTNRKFITFLIGAVVLILGVVYLQSSASEVKSVRLTGAKLHEATYYEQVGNIAIGDFYWSVQPKKVKSQLEAIPEVKEVTVTRKLWNELIIQVEEWPTIAYVEDQSGFIPLLGNGKVFSTPQPIPATKAPIIRNFKKKSYEELARQLTEIDKSIYSMMSEVTYQGTKKQPFKLTIYMDDGYEVRALLPTLAEKIAYYPEVVAQLTAYDKGIIDIEVGTFFIPFSKMFGEESEEIANENKEQEQ